MGLYTIDVRGEAYQASEIAIDHHTCAHRDHSAKERVDEQVPREIYHSDTEAPCFKRIRKTSVRKKVNDKGVYVRSKSRKDKPSYDNDKGSTPLTSE